MRKRTSPAASRTNEIEDGTPSNASTNWVMAGLFIALATGAYAYFRPPLDFDFNSQEFNPFVFVPLGFLKIAPSSLVPAVRGALIERKFGKTVFAMEGDDVELGATLKGMIRCSVDLAPTADQGRNAGYRLLRHLSVRGDVAQAMIGHALGMHFGKTRRSRRQRREPRSLQGAPTTRWHALCSVPVMTSAGA